MLMKLFMPSLVTTRKLQNSYPYHLPVLFKAPELCVCKINVNVRNVCMAYYFTSKIARLSVGI